MTRKNQMLRLNAEGLLAEVVGFETDEVGHDALGAHVATYRGREFIDFTGGIAVHACGHCHPEIVAAIGEQAAKLQHVSDTMRHAPQLELAQKLAELFEAASAGATWSFLFLNGGSESIDAAAKLALKLTGRTRFVAFQGAFHGRTLFTTALSRSRTSQWAAYEGFLESMRERIHHAPRPNCPRDCPATEALDTLEQLLAEIGADVAALFFEAQQGEGGYLPMSPAAARRMRDLTSRHGILLVADEIQSGFGRTGRWFGFEHLGITPDIVVFGKAIGGGLPLAGLAAPRALMQRWEPGEHGTTFGGNPVACAAGLAALRIIERDGLVEGAAQKGEQIKARLRPMVGSHGLFDVRGHGLMIGAEFRAATGGPDYARVEAIKRRCREDGLLILSCGARIGDPGVDNSTLRLIPPLNIPDDMLEQGLTIFQSAIARE